MADTQNMIIVSLERVRKQLKLQLACGDYSPFIIIGKSGIGKTESIASLAEELGIGFTEIRLSHYEESDLIGMPYRDENNKTKHAVTDLLPDTNDQGQGILMLDEITSSNRNMRSAVYQLTDSRRSLGQYKLPPKWIVVCCGNGPEDGGDFRGMEPALLSRGRCVRVEEDLGAWKAWAIKNGVHPVVVAFLSFMPDKLHVIDIDKPFDLIACPRNWVKLSLQLYNMENDLGTDLDDDDLYFAASCCVGESCGPSFAAFYKYNKSVISVEDIINNRAKPSDVKTIDEEVMYILVQQLVSYVKKMMDKAPKDRTGRINEDAVADPLAKIFNWIIEAGEKFRVDLAVMAIQDLVQNIDGLTDIVLMGTEFEKKCPAFLTFASKNAIITNSSISKLL